MALVGQHQQTAFSDPQAGQSPMAASVVRGNDNAIRAAHNAHDADATIHVQTGLLANRPAAGTAYAMYMDENRRLYVDNGSAWAEVPYVLPTAASTTLTGDLTVQGNGAVEGDFAVDGVSAFGGNVGVTGTVTATTFSGAHTGDGSGLTGIDAAGLAGDLDVDSVTTDALTLASGRAVGHRITSSGGSTTLNCATSNWFRHTLESNATITLSNLTSGQAVIVEVLQNGTGGWTLAWSGVTSWDDGNTVPSVTTTANRKDLYAFVRAGADTLGIVLGQNYASTA